MVQMVPSFVGQALEYWNELLYRRKFILSGFFILLNLVILTGILILSYKVGPYSIPVQVLTSTPPREGPYLLRCSGAKII